jgi:hypothetical protein
MLKLGSQEGLYSNCFPTSLLRQIRDIIRRLLHRSLRSRRLVRAGEERASFEETPAQMPMINLFFSEESLEKLPIGQSR